MDALHGMTNETFKDFVNLNVTDSVIHHSAQRTNLQRFLYSYDSVNKVYTPILFLFGAIGNILSIIVFCTAPSHRHLSSSFYLSALAISDIGYLVNLLVVWLEDAGIKFLTSDWVCPSVMFLGQVTCFLSVWLTVSFTVERFFAVCYPLTRQTICTVARAKKVITVLSLVALVSFSYVWLIAIVVDFPVPSTTTTILQQQQQPDDEEADLDVLELGGSGDGGLMSEREHMRGRLINSTMFWSDCSSHHVPWVLAPGEKIGTFVPQFDVLCNGTEQNLRTGSGSVGVVGAGAGSPRNWTMETETIRVCYVREEYMYFSSIASHMDSLVTLILPFGIISYLNVRIALTVWKLKESRQSIVALAKMSNINGTGREIKKNNLSSTATCRIPASPSSTNTPVLLLNGGGLDSMGCNSSSSNSNNSQIPNSSHPHPPPPPPPPSSIPVNINLRSSFSSPESSSNSKIQNQPANTNNTYRINLGSSASLNAGICNSPNGGNSPMVGTTTNFNQIRTQRNHHSQSEARVTKTLLLVSTVFLVLNLPAHAIRFIAYIQSWWGLSMVEELQAAQQWANILFNTNFSVNFLLYCVSGRNFRKSLWGICFNRKSSHSARRSKRTILNHPGNRPQLNSINHQSSFSNKNRDKIVVITSDPKEDLVEKNLRPPRNQST